MVQQQSRFGADDEIMPEQRSTHEEVVKMDVTLIDAFKIREINLLICSYVFAMCHNLYILKSPALTGAVEYEIRWFNFGSIFGIICSGALVDLVFKRQRFLTILMLNAFIVVIDLFLYIKDVS